jgi:hypothetical protein
MVFALVQHTRSGDPWREAAGNLANVGFRWDSPGDRLGANQFERSRCLNQAQEYPSHSGFRLGIYVFKDAEIVDFAAPHGVFSVARRFDPELDAFLIADAMRPVQAQAGFTVLPNYWFGDQPAMDAFLVPGGFGTRQEMYNCRLHEFIRSLPETCLLTKCLHGIVDLREDGSARW